MGIKHPHWLDHASDKYDNKLIEEIKIMLKVLVLFLPVPIYWALYDQQVSKNLNRFILWLSFILADQTISTYQIKRCILTWYGTFV